MELCRDGGVRGITRRLPAPDRSCPPRTGLGGDGHDPHGRRRCGLPVCWLVFRIDTLPSGLDGRGSWDQRQVPDSPARTTLPGVIGGGSRGELSDISRSLRTAHLRRPQRSGCRFSQSLRLWHQVSVRQPFCVRALLSRGGGRMARVRVSIRLQGASYHYLLRRFHERSLPPGHHAASDRTAVPRRCRVPPMCLLARPRPRC